ncbi:MAG: SMP-30/gluconolactonase/LRE family protein [Kiloniellales bacterium]|nr:SMP-30/gluconolactonase/LRE family protein [Kiloniellales bacterium]
MADYTPEPLIDGFRFLEGPRWHAGRLWMSDMGAGKVYTLSEAGELAVVVEVRGDPSGLGFLPDGTPLIVSMQDRRLLRLENGALVCHADLAPLVGDKPNDMVVDRRGRAYIGNFGYDIEAEAPFRPANLVLVEPSGEARVVADDLAFPNGTVILEDGKTLVVAESDGHCLTAFAIAADGSLSDRRCYADLGEHDPDGICLDRDGGIWVSSFSHDVYLRVLEGGEVTDRVPVPGRRAVACQLGGSDGRTLFCLTCASSWADLCAGAGGDRARVETARVAVSGAGSP